MAIKNIIANGIGFDPGNTDWIVTQGFGILAVASVAGLEYTMQPNRLGYTLRENEMGYTMQPNRIGYTMRPN
jgi:hypothetical protein